jgi:hypothetical protein
MRRSAASRTMIGGSPACVAQLLPGRLRPRNIDLHVWRHKQRIKWQTRGQNGVRTVRTQFLQLSRRVPVRCLRNLASAMPA